MTWGNNNAGPVGVQPFAPGVVGQPPGQAGANIPPFYNAGFESIYAAMCRGEIPANIGVGVTGLNGVGPANNQTSLLQAISQGVPQNGTNGIGVVSGYGIGAGNGPGVSAVISGNGGLGAATIAASGAAATSFGGVQPVDAKAMANVPTLANPIQYAGN